MAEFVQTMKDWIRMCGSFKSCSDCPMMDADGWAHVLCSEGGIQSAKPEIAEKVIASWAAEHPEPVYPTWFEWMKSIGVLHTDQTLCHRGLEKPIPADIAEKLGIEPKGEA